MKHYMLKTLLSSALMLILTACADDTPDFSVPAVSDISTLEPVDDIYCRQSYEGEDAKTEDEVLQTFSSGDGLCRIDKKPSYYEVYLDYTKGTHYDVGCAYAKCLLDIGDEFIAVLEPFLYENIYRTFPSIDGDYSPVLDRMDKILVNIPEDYRKELEGYAQTLSGDKKGFECDGAFSYEEALLANMIDSVLRANNCNAVSLWGEKTVTGGRIVSRTMEWPLGSENQMCTAHCVTHFINGKDKNSYTGFSVLGMLDAITVLNDKEVFAGLLDVGTGMDFNAEGKKCYAYELRYALENMPDARSVGEYMVSESKNFTYTHNIIITDRDNSFVAENNAYEGDEYSSGQSILRDQDTPLLPGITWDVPDCLCVVNAHVTDGCLDKFTYSGSNYTRFCKYRDWLGEKDKFSLADVKSMVTREKVDSYTSYQKIYSDIVFEIIIYDYSTRELDACFIGEEGTVDHPVFTKIEH